MPTLILSNKDTSSYTSVEKCDEYGSQDRHPLMQKLHERLLRAHDPLPPAEALREAAQALRDHEEYGGTESFAPGRLIRPLDAVNEVPCRRGTTPCNRPHRTGR